MLDIFIPTTKDLDYVAQALAEGEHDLGETATAAGYALFGMWPTNDCPWGRVAVVPADRGRIAIAFAAVEEGPLYAPSGSEDGCLVVYDCTVIAVASGKTYRHRTFTRCGWCRQEDGFAVVDRASKREAAAFAARVNERGTIDLAHWELVPERQSLAERFAQYAAEERLEREGR